MMLYYRLQVDPNLAWKFSTTISCVICEVGYLPGRSGGSVRTAQPGRLSDKKRGYNIAKGSLFHPDSSEYF